MLLHQMFIKTAKQFAGKLAVSDQTTGRKLTYNNALIASLILADKFSSYEEGFLGIMIPNSAGSYLSILGALMSGRVPVMINYSTGAASNILYAQKKCAFHTVITSRTLLEKIKCPVIPGMIFIEDILAGISIADKLKAAIKAKLPTLLLSGSIHGGKLDDNAVILFTSGSEKEPRAVQLTHRNIFSNLVGLSKVYDFTSSDIFLSNLPFFHVFGLTTNYWIPIYYGMTAVPYANPLDFKMICDIVREEKATLMTGTPTFFWGYVNKSEPGDFSSVRIMISGADKCPDALREAMMKKHNIVMLEGYGCTETSPVITVNTHKNNRPGSVGKALPNVQIHIENYETGESCKKGETGKILVKGDLVMKGYFDDFEETSLHIRHGWYDTGDMGMMDKDGFLWHVGRLRRFVKIGGEMVSLIRIENALEQYLPSGIQCCIVEVPDAIKGARIVAVVTAPIDEKATLQKLRSDLPNISLPKQFIVMEELPKMGSGKIDFRTLTNRVIDLQFQL